jgi:SAM-dependent methyltransferase
MENIAVYRSPRVVKQLKGMTQSGLTPVEDVCFSFVPASSRRSILDVGVGAGRTTGALLKMFASYLGVDYSDKLIAEAKTLFPDADLRTMDARDLKFSEPFDCVMFSFNGIDYVSYSERQLILRQIAGVVRPDGYFIYSTHNLRWTKSAAFLKRLLVGELFKPLPRVHTVIRLIGNRLRNFWRQSYEDRSHAYINDSAAEFRLLTTYVDIEREIDVLKTLGFDVVATIGNAKQAVGHDASDGWVYIVAKRL